MREIKFRAWDNEHARMIHDVVPMPAGNGANKPSYDNRNVMRVNWKLGDSYSKGGPWEPLNIPDCIVEQFTGLKDKNGKDIYEGDIVRDHILDIKTHKPQKVARIFVVYWDEKTASFWQRLVKDPSMQYRAGSNFAAEKNGEVIGNIHENPELLK